MSNTPSTRQPSYRLHKPTGQAVVTLNGRDHYLGKYGTRESRAEYDRLIAEWLSGGRRLPDANTAVTIAAIIQAYWPHVETHYRRLDGTPTSEIDNIRRSLRPLNHLYGSTPAAAFGPLAFKAVRQLMIDGYEHPKYGREEPLCRGVVNRRMGRIKRMFRWAVEQELVSGSVYHALQAVRGLQRGRTAAYEAPAVKPVARAVVEDTLPLLRPTMRDMVMLQLETGMRPGEMVTMRACDIDMSGVTWLYSPPQHKTLHHGHERCIAIGPRGQEIIKRHLTANMQAPLFSPRRLMEERAEAMRAQRQTPVQPSQLYRRKMNPKKQPGEAYTTFTYGHAIAVAIRRQNKNKPDAEHIPHWHPNQLRHLRALELKRQFGLDVARAVLGHRQPCITEHYAGVDTATASEVMGKVG